MITPERLQVLAHDRMGEEATGEIGELAINLLAAQARIKELEGEIEKLKSKPNWY